MTCSTSAAHQVFPHSTSTFWQTRYTTAGLTTGRTQSLPTDRGTSTGPRFAAKVQRYLDYRDEGHYAARYGLQRFRVLVLGPSTNRLGTLQRVTSDLAERAFWFALTSETKSLTSLSPAVFHRLDGASPQSLISIQGAA